MKGPIQTTLAFATLALLAGCAVGPDYRRPVAVETMPVSYAGATNEWKLAAPAAHLLKGAWWEVFGDAELNRIEARAAEANQQLQAAVARFEQARAAADVARSGLFPHIGVGFSAARQRDSANRPLPTTGEAAGKSFNYDNFVLPFDLSYELDLWGRVRRQIESARAAARADAADLEAVRLVVAAEVAADYFALRALDAEIAAVRASIEAYGKALDLTRDRRAGGLASDLDVVQAQTVLNTAEAQLPALELARQKFQHALAMLVGQPATLFQLPPAPLNTDPPVIPAEVPSALLERRPDVAAAEERMAAANAAIGVAKAAFFPTVRFNGLAGLQSIDAGSLFDWPSRFWAVGPSLSLPLFDAGQRRARFRMSKAAYDETVARYRDTVLRAFAEVEDQLAAQRLLAAQFEREMAALASARKQLELALNRYRSGLVSYLHVTAAQNAVLERERAVARLRGQRFAAAVAMVKSLGGGFKSESSTHTAWKGETP
ncbi:MAG: efflux transporter outer membrane subunit [Verrucomicrobiia bacterium]